MLQWLLTDTFEAMLSFFPLWQKYDKVIDCDVPLLLLNSHIVLFISSIEWCPPFATWLSCTSSMCISLPCLQQCQTTVYNLMWMWLHTLCVWTKVCMDVYIENKNDGHISFRGQNKCFVSIGLFNGASNKGTLRNATVKSIIH